MTASPSDTLTGHRLREVLDNRQVTRDLIDYEGRMVQLWRNSDKVPDGAGGWVAGSGQPAPQTAVKRFFSLNQQEPYDSSDQQGETLQETFVLVGTHTDDIREGDWFFINDNKHVIRFVHSDRSYQVKAEGRYDSDG